MTQSHHGGPEYHSTTTLNAIRKASPCENGWLKLLKHLGKTKADDEPLDLLTVLDSNGLDDALWVMSYAKPDDRLARHFQAWCAEQVLPIFEAECPNDRRVRDQIAMLRNDDATYEERAAARAAARTAAWGAAWGAARTAARTAAWATVWDAARTAARAAAWAAARNAQERQLRKMLAAREGGASE